MSDKPQENIEQPSELAADELVNAKLAEDADVADLPTSGPNPDQDVPGLSGLELVEGSRPGDFAGMSSIFGGELPPGDRYQRAGDAESAARLPSALTAIRERFNGELHDSA